MKRLDEDKPEELNKKEFYVCFMFPFNLLFCVIPLMKYKHTHMSHNMYVHDYDTTGASRSDMANETEMVAII